MNVSKKMMGTVGQGASLFLIGCSSPFGLDLQDRWSEEGTTWVYSRAVLEGEMAGEMPGVGGFERPVTEGWVGLSSSGDELGFDLLAEEGTWARMQGSVQLGGLGDGVATRLDQGAFNVMGSSGSEVVRSPTQTEWIESYVASAEWLYVTRERFELGGEPMWALTFEAWFDATDPPWDLVIDRGHSLHATVLVPSLDPDRGR